MKARDPILRHRRRLGKRLLLLYTIAGQAIGLVGALFLWPHWSALVALAMGVGIDATDGSIARRWQLESHTGAVADRLGDCINAHALLFALPGGFPRPLAHGVLAITQLVALDAGVKWAGRTMLTACAFVALWI